jgi:hypothetical protein
VRGGEHTHRSVPALRVGIVADDGGIATLEVLFLGRLDAHGTLGLKADGLGVGSLGAAGTVDSSRHCGCWRIYGREGTEMKRWKMSIADRCELDFLWWSADGTVDTEGLV